MSTEENTIRKLIGKDFCPSRITEPEVENVNLRDYPDFTDAYLVSAVWIIDDTELTEEELEEMCDSNPGWLYDIIHDSIF